MSSAFVLILLTAVTCVTARIHLSTQERHEWHRYKISYNKSYTHVEEPRRLQIWLDNQRFVDDHNDLDRHDVELNDIADLTPAEYMRLNGFRRSYGDSLAKVHGAHFLPPLGASPVPESVDWRKHGLVTPVKNQGMCGSCWAFSSTGALEGQHARSSNGLTSLSEQNLVDCSTSYGNHGCNGGLMDQAFQYIKDNEGIDTEQSYPYEGTEQMCRFRKEGLGATDVGFTDIPTGDEDALKLAVATVGPVSIAIDASHKSFQLYKKGVYVEPDCSASALDHGVLIVGYGVDEDGQDYWLVKNSWGPKWGEKGYIRMARNLQNQCGVATAASYPLV